MMLVQNARIIALNKDAVLM